MGDPGADCTESFLGLGQELPEVVGDTAWYDQYAPAGMSDRFRGSPEKLGDVAGSWRAGGKMMLRFLEDAQAYAHTADKAHSGEAADAFRRLRVAGYPEREVPLVGRKRGLMVDGIRPVDGYLIEAKHVRDPDCNKRSYRSIERVNETLAKPVKVDAKGNPKFDPLIDGMYRGDETELGRYKSAMANPSNSEIRGLEIVTNGKDNAAYWESMMAMSGVTGSARYVP